MWCYICSCSGCSREEIKCSVQEAVTHMVLRHLVPTLGTQLIGPSGQTVPNQFCPHGQMVLNKLWWFGNMGTKLVWDHLSMGTKSFGTICPWGQNWLRTVCPERPINWGPNVRGPYVFGTKCVTAHIHTLALTFEDSLYHKLFTLINCTKILTAVCNHQYIQFISIS